MQTTSWAGQLRSADLDDLSMSFEAMATNVELRIIGAAVDAQERFDQVVERFLEVEHACTRFDPTSPLMRANAAPDQWHDAPAVLVHAVQAASDAHQLTEGLFDPRVLSQLTALGYDRTLPFDSGSIALSQTGPSDPWRSRPQWTPQIDAERSRLRLGPTAVDLGGIGKGFAVRRAAGQLQGAGLGFLVNAGGDCYVGGQGPSDGHWLIGVESPAGGDEPAAVLRLRDRACATSSIRRRQWRVNGRPVHHLIDPRTGHPGDGGLLAVTVVGDDTMLAEVWSKTLFLVGADDIASEADRRGLAALWVRDDGAVDRSDAMVPFVTWQASHVQ